MDFRDGPAEAVTCTFIVTSANQPLFAEERAHLPSVGDPVSHEGHTYRVLSASLQAGAAMRDEPVAHPAALVRVEPCGEEPEKMQTQA